MNNQNIERVTDGGDHAHDKQAMIPMGQAGPSHGTQKVYLVNKMDFCQVVHHLTSNESRMDSLNALGSSERRSSVSSSKTPNASFSSSPDQINQPTTYSLLNKATTQGIYHEQNNQPISTSKESSADHAESSNTQKNKNLGENILEIVHLVWHIVDLSLIALDILPGAINGTLELIAQSGSSTIVVEDIVAKMLDQHVKKMKPKSVVKRLKKKFLGDDQIKSIHLCGEMIDDIENQLKAVFGQSLFNMETKPEAYLVKTKLLFFYRRLYRKLFGLLEAPYDGNGIEKFKIMPNKSEKEALLIWLYGAMKYLSMEFNSSLIKFTALDREHLLQIFVKFDQIETCKERMNLAFFAVDVTVAPLIDAYLSSKLRLEQFEPALNLKQIFMLANQFSFGSLNSRMAYATTFKHIYYTSMQKLMAKYAGQKELITIKNATIYAKVYDAILSDLFTPETEAIIHNIEFDTFAWHLIKSFLAKCVEQLNELINYWDQGICAASQNRHLRRDICASSQNRHLRRDICASSQNRHLRRDICASSQNRHLRRDICASSQNRHLRRDICASSQNRHLRRDICASSQK
uniref:Uncharacterized protein n=1 Tax=Globodera rostochiensis TaxID=31243 RepID=A0A914HLX8_GLORO